MTDDEIAIYTKQYTADQNKRDVNNLIKQQDMELYKSRVIKLAHLYKYIPAPKRPFFKNIFFETYTCPLCNNTIPCDNNISFCDGLVTSFYFFCICGYEWARQSV